VAFPGHCWLCNNTSGNVEIEVAGKDDRYCRFIAELWPYQDHRAAEYLYLCEWSVSRQRLESLTADLPSITLIDVMICSDRATNATINTCRPVSSFSTPHSAAPCGIIVLLLHPATVYVGSLQLRAER
jgi:hypothetical protein